MAKAEPKEGQILAKELTHTMEYLSNMGFNTETMTILEAFSFIRKVTQAMEELGYPQDINEITNPY